MQSTRPALIAQQRLQIGNTTTSSTAAAAIDSAPGLAQANRDYATRNADQGSMMASASLKASNDATAARQLAEQMNANGGQVTPLLFGNDASAGGGYSLKAQQLAEAQLANARNGGLNVTVTGAPPRDVVSTKTTNFAAEGVNKATTLRPIDQAENNSNPNLPRMNGANSLRNSDSIIKALKETQEIISTVSTGFSILDKVAINAGKVESLYTLGKAGYLQESKIKLVAVTELDKGEGLFKTGASKASLAQNAKTFGAYGKAFWGG